jgi:hypothetical protein
MLFILYYTILYSTLLSTETEIVKHSEDAYAPVIYLIIKNAVLEDKI